MYIFSLHLVLLIIKYEVSSIPPSPCFAPFKWQDCGKPPTPVMYYWKPGSRCEVGLWRGCLPNLNMFKDEYECVATCIFSVRAADEDYHKLNQLSGEIDYQDYVNEQDDNGTEVENGTDGGNDTGDGNASDGGDGGDNATDDSTGGGDAPDDGGGNGTADNASNDDAPAEGEETPAPEE